MFSCMDLYIYVYTCKSVFGRCQKKQPRTSVSGTRVNDERPRLLQQDYKIIIIIQTPDSVL